MPATPAAPPIIGAVPTLPFATYYDSRRPLHGYFELLLRDWEMIYFRYAKTNLSFNGQASIILEIFIDLKKINDHLITDNAIAKLLFTS